MLRVFLNRSVQIRPKSWRDMVQGIFSQVLTLMTLDLVLSVKEKARNDRNRVSFHMEQS
jgi:hypothetical protein